MGLRKFKSEKDLKGKLRKTRTSDEGARTAAQHQRLPSVPPVLPIPSHISIPHSSASTLSSSSTGSTVQASCSATQSTSSRAQHRRSRSFSTLTALLSPSISAEQPWRSREAWLAIHSRSPSPPLTSTLPSAPGGADGGWRRKGNGGFFARELAGVGESALGLPVYSSSRPGLGGSGRSRTMGELNRPVPTRQNSDPIPADITASVPTADSPGSATLHDEWRPGFATSLFREKTHAAIRTQPVTPPDQECADTPPSRPESRILPESVTPPTRLRRAGSQPSTPADRSTTTTISTCSVAPSDRTSRSSSIHTYEQSELYHVAEVAEVDDDHGAYGPDVDIDMLAHRCDEALSTSVDLLRPHPSDVPHSPSSSPLLPRTEHLPTIVTPTSTYYHFGSVHSVNGRPVSNVSNRSYGSRRDRERGEENRISGLAERVKRADTANGETDQNKWARTVGGQAALTQTQVHRQSRTVGAQVRHARDESLPPLLPPSASAQQGRRMPYLADPNAPGTAVSRRMRDLPWARSQTTTIAAGDTARRLPDAVAAPPIPRRSVKRDDKSVSRKTLRSIREAEGDLPPLPSPGVRERWSRVYEQEKERRGSESTCTSGSGSTDGHRGGWI